MSAPQFSIVIPVYNEADNIVALLRGLEEHVAGDYEILIVYDFDEDTTLPTVAAMDPPVPQVRLVKNNLGRGAVNALRAGFAASEGWLGVVVTMGDLSDPPERINSMVETLLQGYDVVAGSRYMRGGQMVGGPLVKGLLSRMAGLSAYWLSGIGIHDVTTNFRAYSRRLVKQISVESKGGFELGLELTVKAHLRGWRVGEVPSEWYDRTAGESRFQLFKWLPGYLRWYLLLLFRDPLGTSRRIARLRENPVQPADYGYFGVYDLAGYGWIAARHRPGVIVVASTEDGSILFVRQKRPMHGSEEDAWELPGGEPRPRESLLATAKRELLEETGYATDDNGTVCGEDLEAIPGMGTFPHRVVMLTECRKTSEPTTTESERIHEVAAFNESEIHQLIADGRLTALPSLAALMLVSITQNATN